MMTSQTPPAGILPALVAPRTVTDQVFDLLYERVVNLSLPPGAKLSEAEVAAQMGVSLKTVEKHLRLGLAACRAYLDDTDLHAMELAQ